MSNCTSIFEDSGQILRKDRTKSAIRNLMQVNEKYWKWTTAQNDQNEIVELEKSKYQTRERKVLRSSNPKQFVT